jgi:hypothetical protein
MADAIAALPILFVAVEQIVGSGAAQPLTNRPNMGFDDRTAERTVERRDMELRVWRTVKDVRFHCGTLSHLFGDNPVMAPRYEIIAPITVNRVVELSIDPPLPRER